MIFDGSTVVKSLVFIVMKTKKQLKEEYKQMKFPIGVFQIRNTTNNMVCIDTSTDMESKWNRHKMELKLGTHRNHALQKAWNEKGEGCFVFEVLSELEDKAEEDLNYQKELKTLRVLVIEELGIDDERVYK